MTTEAIQEALDLVSSEPVDGVDTSHEGSGRYVEVAIDAAGGAGRRTYTYSVPPTLADLQPGEAVLVEFGRRQALGVVMADVPRPADVVPKPVLDRVRADGPLLPDLTLR